MSTEKEDMISAIEFERDSVEDDTYGGYQFEAMEYAIQFAALIGFFYRIRYELTETEMDILAKEVISPECDVYRKI